MIVRQRQPLHRTDDAEARVGDGHVEAAERGARRRDGALEVAVAGYVATDGERAASSALNLGGQGGEPIGPARGKHDVGALIGEGTGQRRADSRRGASDENDLAGELQGPWRTIASSAKAAAILALRTASPWSRLVLALSWWALASATCFLASSIKGLVSAVTLPDSAFLMRSSACLITTGHVKAAACDAAMTISARVRMILTRFMLHPSRQPQRRSLGECSMGLPC